MKRIAVVIDPWDYPFNGTVVSARRFVEALQPRFDFSLLAISPANECCDSRIARFGQLSIPGFNGIINSMKAPLARPDRQRLREVLADCACLKSAHILAEQGGLQGLLEEIEILEKDLS